MPSTTFFNLPQPKRTRLLQAAREEFSHVPYDEVSINRIIHAAGIPRGSFYMYFQDKEDLFRYLLEDYLRRFVDQFLDILREVQGDLFSAFRNLFDLATGQGRDQAEVREFSALLRLNAGLQQGPLLRSISPQWLMGPVLAEIDRSRLSIQREGDLEDILHILIDITLPSLCAAANQEKELVRERYLARLDILSRGMSAQGAVPSR